MHQHPLDRGAALTGVLVGAGRSQRGGFFHVGIFHHDDRVVTAQLKHLTLVDRLGGDVLADRHAAGERDQVHIGVGQQFVGDLARVAGQHRQHLGRQAGFVQHVGQHVGGQRRLLAGLDHDPVVGGHRRRDLVDHLVERVIERRDRADRAQQRLAQRVDLARLAVMGQVAGEHLAVVDQRLVGGEQQHVAGAAHLVGAVLHAQARFERDDARDLGDAAGDDLTSAHQDPVAVVACQRAAVLAGDAKGTAHVFQRGLGHRGDQLAGIRKAHLDAAVAIDLAAGDAELFVLDGDAGGRGLLAHDVMVGYGWRGARSAGRSCLRAGVTGRGSARGRRRRSCASGGCSRGLRCGD